jgi:hypothetical protein
MIEYSKPRKFKLSEIISRNGERYINLDGHEYRYPEYFYFSKDGIMYRLSILGASYWNIDVFADPVNPDWDHWTKGWHHWSTYYSYELFTKAFLSESF